VPLAGLERPEHRIAVDASGVDVEVVWRLILRHGHDPQLLQLQRILHPRIVRRTGQETGEHYDDFVDWPAGETHDNVACSFARLVGLPHYRWLRWSDDARDGGGMDPAWRGQGRELTRRFNEEGRPGVV
jgi:hypothetical protein